MKCSYFPKCRACSNWDIPYESQKYNKISALKKLLDANSLSFKNEIFFLSAGSKGLRHKADFAIHYDAINKNYNYGYYGDSGEIVNIKECLQFSSELKSVFDSFLNVGLPVELEIKKLSIRLRVGPNSEKGIWIDCSNTDIKKLLDEKLFLQKLRKSGFIIEMGQKKKHLEFFDDTIKLSSPKLNPWFKTWRKNGQEHILQSYISSFTQPGWYTGELLITELKKSLANFHPNRIVEFGAGIGFFSRVLSESCNFLTILEVDSFSHEPLKVNLPDNLDTIDIRIADFHNRNFNLNHELAFVNPARSGLKSFALDLMNLYPEKIIYVSCFPESMINDLKVLSQKYELCYISIVDQFPQTDHYEVYCELNKLS